MKNLHQHELQGEKSVLVRFRSGFILYIKPNIKTQLAKLIEELRNDPNHKAVFERLIEKFHDRIGTGIHPDSTWYCAVKEIVKRYEELGEFDQTTKAVFIDLLSLISEGPEGESIDWDKISKFILENIEPLTGWARVKVERDRFLEGMTETSQAIIIIPGSGKTLHVKGKQIVNDDFIDHVSADATSRGGKLGLILKLIALVEISSQYQSHPEHFRDRICCSLPDGDWGDYTAYLQWQWWLLGSRDLRPVFWSPRSCYSNEKWLSYDLLAQVASSQGEQLPPLEPTGEAVSQFEEAFREYDRQLEFTLDTNLYLGDKREIYFEFLGRKVRWINGTPFECPLLTVPCNNGDNSEGLKIGRKFLSLLVENTGYPVVEMSTGGRGTKEYLPMFVQPRQSGGVGLRENILAGKNFSAYSEEKWRALALFKDGINSRNVYYSFLNFYKILELGSLGAKTRVKATVVKTWIRDHLPKTREYTVWQSKLQPGHQADEYLSISCRHAIAHVKADSKKYSNVIDPDDPITFQRIREDLDIIQSLAKMMIEEM